METLFPGVQKATLYISEDLRVDDLDTLQLPALRELCLKRDPRSRLGVSIHWVGIILWETLLVLETHREGCIHQSSHWRRQCWKDLELVETASTVSRNKVKVANVPANHFEFDENLEFYIHMIINVFFIVTSSYTILLEVCEIEVRNLIVSLQPAMLGQIMNN